MNRIWEEKAKSEEGKKQVALIHKNDGVIHIHKQVPHST